MCFVMWVSENLTIFYAWIPLHMYFIRPMSNLKPPRATHSLVAKETTGKDFRMLRHFSRSINNEFDLIFRSCSSLALFCNNAWNNLITTTTTEGYIVIFVVTTTYCLPGGPFQPHSVSCWVNQCSLEAAQPRKKTGSAPNTSKLSRETAG